MIGRLLVRFGVRCGVDFDGVRGTEGIGIRAALMLVAERAKPARNIMTFPLCKVIASESRSELINSSGKAVSE